MLILKNDNMLFSFEALFRKLAIHQIATSTFRKETFGQEHFDESLAICQICQDFLPPKFCIVRYVSTLDSGLYGINTAKHFFSVLSN